MFPVNDLGKGEVSGKTDDKDVIDDFYKDDKGDKEKEDESPKDKEIEDKTPEEDEEEADDKEDEEEEDEEVDEDEDKEDEDKEDEEVDEDLKADSIYQQLKSADKEIFKKVPGLKQVIFRERAFTEIFSSPNEAEEAAKGVELLSNYQNDLISGNSEPLLKALQKVDDNALEGFVANFIPTLEKVNKDLYVQTILPEIKKILRVAKKNPDERISKAATNLHYFVFGDGEFDKDEGLKPKKEDPAEKRISQREKEFEQKVFTSFRGDVVSVCNNKVRSVVSRIFDGVELPKLQQKHLTEEIIERVNSEVDKDKRHMGHMASLWNKARAAGFTTEWKDRITSAYLSRAKMSIPKHRKDVLSEAKVVAKEKEDKDKPKRPTPSGRGPVRDFSGKSLDPKTVDWKRTTDRDVLDGKVTLRK